MEKTTRAVLAAASVIAAAFVVIVAAISLYAANVPDIPRWEGRGDWVACSAVASVSPEEAVRTATQGYGLSKFMLGSYFASVEPVHVNESGKIFRLMCTGGIAIGEPWSPSEYHMVTGPQHAWAVGMSDENTLCMPSYTFVEFDVGTYMPHGQSVC